MFKKLMRRLDRGDCPNPIVKEVEKKEVYYLTVYCEVCGADCNIPTHRIQEYKSSRGDCIIRTLCPKGHGIVIERILSTHIPYYWKNNEKLEYVDLTGDVELKAIKPTWTKRINKCQE